MSNTDILFDDNEEKDEFSLDVSEELEEETKTKEDDKKGEVVTFGKQKVALISKLLQNVKENNDKLIDLMSGVISSKDIERISIGQMSDNTFESTASGENESGRIVEGVFDGETMIGPDGKQYSVPANYASKSKLVEGDLLKLTITGNGTFVYKQISPIDRKRVAATLEEEGGIFYAVFEGEKWRLLNASVTYYKGQPGDEVVILIPKAGDSKWGTVENIVKKNL